MAKTGQGAPATELRRNAESFSKRCQGFSVLLVEWSQLQNTKLSKTVCSKGNGTSDKLVYQLLLAEELVKGYVTVCFY